MEKELSIKENRKQKGNIQGKGLCSVSGYFLYMVELEINWFAYVYLIVLAQFVEMTILSLLNCLWIFFKNQLTICMAYLVYM